MLKSYKLTIMLKITFLRNYRNKKSNMVFVYSVTGTAEELERYKNAQGDFYREDEEGAPIFFSSKYVGESTKLIITSKDKCIPDTSEFDKAASIITQYGGDLGTALANAFASKLTSSPAVTSMINKMVEPDDKLDS